MIVAVYTPPLPLLDGLHARLITAECPCFSSQDETELTRMEGGLITRLH